MSKKIADMTPAQVQANRAYMAEQKRLSRKRRTADGLCSICTTRPVKDGLNPQSGKPYRTCPECMAYALERDRKVGWFRPVREARRLRREGKTVPEIAKEVGKPQKFVSQVLREANLL
jgi:hypothetical protein